MVKVCHVEWIFVELGEGFPGRKESRAGRFFVGTEHKLRGGAADQEWNTKGTNGENNAGADARSTAEVEDGKHATGGVMIARRKNMASVEETTGGKVESLEENAGTIAQLWVNCEGGLHIFAVYLGRLLDC